MVLTGRDVELLVHLYKARMLIGEQVRLYHFNNSNAAYRRLAILRRAGYIGSLPYYDKTLDSRKRMRRAGHYYYLAPRGVDELYARGLVGQDLRSDKIVPGDVPFALALCRAQYELVISGTISLADWCYQREVREHFSFHNFVPVYFSVGGIIGTRYNQNIYHYLLPLFKPALGASTAVAQRAVVICDNPAELWRALQAPVFAPVHATLASGLPGVLHALLSGGPDHYITLLSRWFFHRHGTLAKPPVHGWTIAGEPPHDCLLAEFITGSIPAFQRFAGWYNNRRFLLVRSREDVPLSLAGGYTLVTLSEVLPYAS